MKNRFDWFLMVLFLANTIMTAIDGNYTATLGWACASMTLGRVLTNNLGEE